MTKQPVDRVDYDRVAPTYHQRYHVNDLPGVAAALQTLAREIGSGRILEVGCGTGRWLVELQGAERCVWGLDPSRGMLQQGRRQQPELVLANGPAEYLPFPNGAFDLIFCVNAFHHFRQPRRFIAEARRILRPGGRLAIIGEDPHSGRNRWYLYDYFPEARDLDLARFPSAGDILDWLVAAGFDTVSWRTVEHIRGTLTGRAVLDDHFLQKSSTSQLILLSDEAYQAGLDRIKTALAEAEAANKTLVFPTSIFLDMLAGQTPVPAAS